MSGDTCLESLSSSVQIAGKLDVPTVNAEVLGRDGLVVTDAVKCTFHTCRHRDCFVLTLLPTTIYASTSCPQRD